MDQIPDMLIVNAEIFTDYRLRFTISHPLPDFPDLL